MSFSELVTLIYLNLINKNIARPIIIIIIISRTMMMISCKKKIKKNSLNKLIRKSHKLNKFKKDERFLD
jgi:hypothetical protein